MRSEAPRHRSRLWKRLARGALLVSGTWLAATGAALAADPPPDCLDEITGAAFGAPTDRYPHAVLGDALEWGALTLSLRLKQPCRAGRAGLRLVLPEELVFEDLSPRMADVDGDGKPEVIVVESHRDRGARLAIWGIGPVGAVRRAATPFIGTRFRWLAPIGIGDLDGDGFVELAYVDRPHLAKTLQVWRFRDGALEPVARAPGFSNHRIGEDFISGGLRDCGAGPEMIVATGDWRRVVAVRLGRDGQLNSQDLGPFRNAASFDAALACKGG